jgi:arachidonate 15-lipoxygenase
MHEDKPKAETPVMQPIQNPEEQKQRALQLSLARTAYNYLRTYPNLDAVPLCAGIPRGEEFTPDYNALVERTTKQLGENFLEQAGNILKEEFAADAFAAALDPKKYLANLFIDFAAMGEGLAAVAAEAAKEGPTAFLKSTLYDMLRNPQVQLRTKDEERYEQLIGSLPAPLMLAMERKDWMAAAAKPCEQDWFFGYLQVAGFNTTNLRGVVVQAKEGSKALTVKDVKSKMGIDDEVFQRVVGDGTLTLEAAAKAGKLYVCDYAALIGDGNLANKESDLHGQHRYLPAPIALFYWNDVPPAGYPPTGYDPNKPGVLQPVAIQLDQATRGALFTPMDPPDERNPGGIKWRIAKYFVNVACAIQHESVAHLGDCHFIIEAVAVAAHRQLADVHRLRPLLNPHLRFTISINNGAITNLIVPEGVVATNVGPNIHWTLQMVNDARKAWRWNDNSPEKIFDIRGVDALPVFPFRDDTRLLWSAILDFVRKYVNLNYKYDADVQTDTELQAFVAELGSPDGGNVQGLSAPRDREELTRLLAQIIYIAGPQHASVNYAQYPLGAYMPSVAATIYRQAPTNEEDLKKASATDWFPPLDVALYTLSFEYLLSTIQYDVLGHYSANPQIPYFKDPRQNRALDEFQSALAAAEVEIVRRNGLRPMPYPFQLPSKVPNGISI